MNKHERRLAELAIIARDVLPIGSARIACAIYDRNELISIGTNKRKSHPFQARFGKHPECIYLHAEIEAIKNALRHTSDLRGYSLYVSRSRLIRDEWNFGLACPCAGCMRAIVTFGINHVYYTTDEGGYEEL